VLLQPDSDVDPISPQIDIVDLRQIPGGEGALLGLPRSFAHFDLEVCYCFARHDVLIRVAIKEGAQRPRR
jgi:hypothetical protein